MAGHPLLEANVKSVIESAASRHLGRSWASGAFTDLNDRASHPCGVLHGEPFSVFAKLGMGDLGGEVFQAELSGLVLLRERAPIPTPTPIGTGLVPLDHGFLLLTEALPERPPQDRTPDDWRSIGHTLATLHHVHDARFGNISMGSSALCPKTTRLSPRTAGSTSIPNGVCFRSFGLPLTPDTYRQTLRLTLNVSCNDYHRSAVQSHSQPCFTATLNSTTLSVPIQVPSSPMSLHISDTPR